MYSYAEQNSFPLCVCAYLNERESKSITHAVTLIVHFLLHVADRCNCICGTSTFFKCMQLCFVFYFFSFFAFRKNCFCYVSLSNSTSPPALPLKLATFCVANIDQCSTYIQLVKTFTFKEKCPSFEQYWKLLFFCICPRKKKFISWSCECVERLKWMFWIISSHLFVVVLILEQCACEANDIILIGGETAFGKSKWARYSFRYSIVV